MLGEIYYYGKGVEQDYKKAAEFFEKSCESGDKYGCYELGKMYEKGEGVEQDKSKALMFYKKACDDGMDDACEKYTELLNS